MFDQQALLRAVAAHPDEDTPRLMYADLLDELGGPANAARARFIRVQIDLARNPGASWFASAERVSEAARLAGRFADEWLGELPKWAADEARKQRLRADDFPRGFLDTFHVHPGTFAAQGNQLLDVAPVVRVAVAPDALKRAGPKTFFHCRHLERVRAVEARGCDGNAVAAVVSASSTLGAVEELDLSGSRLTDGGAVLLARPVDLGGLRVFRARGSNLTAAGAETLLSSPWLPKLHTLDLRGAVNGFRWAREVRLRHLRAAVLV